MKNNYVKLAIIAAVLGILALIFSFSSNKAGAVPQEKVNICHHTHSESNPIEAIRVDADAFDGEGENDHTLHNDFLYSGPVNPQNDQPLKPEGDVWCEGNNPNPTPTVTPEVTPDVTPDVTSTPSATPTPTQPFQGGGGGPGDGKSDGRSSCPECTQAPKTEVPAAPPATGRAGLQPCTLTTCGWK